jgi:hypothetical protein
MSYSDFTIEEVRRRFHLMFRDQPLFPEIGTIEPFAWLAHMLKEGKDLAVLSEKARSEFIVAPVLMACRELLQGKIHVFSGITLNAAPEQGLTGECDFILARTASTFAVQGPLMVVLEAKKNDIEEGLGQCAAQMLGARLYNEKDGTPVPIIYGCVTTGDSWQFSKLEGHELILHPARLRIEEVGKILWLLVECVKDVYRFIPTEAAA